MRRTQLAPILTGLLCLLGAAGASAATPDWGGVADVEEVEVLTTNEDGTTRTTTIWLVVMEDNGYIRTSRSTTWGDNVERDSQLVLRIQDVEYPLRATFVEDEELRERIATAFREKYGWFDGLVNALRGSSPRIMKLDPRE